MKSFVLACAAVALSSFAGRSEAQPVVPPAASNSHAPSLGEALTLARTTNYPSAEKALAAIAGAERPEALVSLARVFLEQGRFADATKAVLQAKGATGGDQRLIALALEGEILAAQGRVDEAIKLLSPERREPGRGGRHVRLQLGELLIRAGHRRDAEPLLLEFANEYRSDQIVSSDAEGLAMVGRAMHLLRHAKDANKAYNESEQAERERIDTLLFRAALYLDKYDPGHAEEVLTEALKLAPHRADAMVLLAGVKLEEAYDFEAAEKLVDDALVVNPRHEGAFAVRAGIALRDANLGVANAAIDAGLAIDPNGLELLSERAAARLLAGDKAGFEAAKREVFARNKEYAAFYGIVGEYAEWEHRYEDVVGLMKEAVLVDPKDEKAWAQLGLWQTRAGDEQEGIASLEQWWKLDHFNVRAYNTLNNLYRKWIPRDYESKTDGVFSVRYPKAERPVLERYAPDMLGEAWGRMKAHYMFAPTTPVHVEIYQSREHFSVRTSGLPSIGIQGVCFGHVVAAMSPGSEPFNWGNVLWHELAHVFAIQLSKNRVPRWFTEGLSEYETMIRRPEWQRELDPELYLAMKKRALPGAVEMNKAFTHAEGDLDMTIAYYAASQMLAFTAEQFGFPGITRALALWGEGRDTSATIEEAFGISPEAYDERFRAWELARLARYQGQYMFDLKPKGVDDARAAVIRTPTSGPAHVTLALALLHAHQTDEALKEIDEALRIDPTNADAHYLAARAAASRKDVDAQEKHLRAIAVAGGDGYTVEMGLAEVGRARSDLAGQRAALEAASRFDPTQVEPQKELLKLAKAADRESDIVSALRAITSLDQHDRAAYGELLEKLVAAKAWSEARSVGQAAIYVDVQNESIHKAYARALSALGDHKAAAFELESALLCGTPPQEEVVLRGLLAQERAAAMGQ